MRGSDSNAIRGELPTYQIQIKRKRVRWKWLVSTLGGDPMMHGSEASRAAAAYAANRAVFLLIATPTANCKSALTRNRERIGGGHSRRNIELWKRPSR